MTYPSNKMPGMGLPCYYHSEYSTHDEMIITLKQDSKLIESQNKNKIIIVIDGKDSGLGKLEVNIIVKLCRYTMKLLYQYLIFLKSKKHIKSFKPDIVHIYSPVGFLIAKYSKRKFNSKVVMSLHGTDIERIRYSRIFQKLMKVPDITVSVSEVAHQKLKKTKFYKQIHTIGNGYEDNVFYDMEIPRKKQIINVGNLRWQKDHKILLNAFGIFLKENPDYDLIIIGEGEERDSLTSQIDELMISENVCLYGIRQRDEIAVLLNQSEFFVLSSVIEGFPKAILESMACGTPVISFDVGNVSSIIQDSGVIVKKREVEALASAMLQLANNQNELKSLSNKSKSIAKKYDWKTVSNKLNNIYLSLQNNKEIN